MTIPPSRSVRSRGWMAASVLAVVAAALAGMREQTAPKATLPNDAEAADEVIVLTPPGFDRPGKRAVADGDQTGIVKLTVLDRTTGRPTFARVNVVGADGNFYEPSDHPLAPFSLGAPYSETMWGVVPRGEEPAYGVGNRPGKGPFRYFGWFFYTSGEASVRVPAGAVRVEVWKGFEYRPVQLSTQVEAGATRAVSVMLDRTLPMSEFHYHSGDTHIHLNRRNESDDERALDLLAAEDIGIGYLLCWNRGNNYTGTMARLSAPQNRGFGPDSIRRRGEQTIASGQEYLSSSFGHICLIMHRQLVQSKQTVETHNWPVFGLIGKETRELGGYSFHAHGGYSQEIYADFAQRATDGVELLQFAEYRGIGLTGWYKILNIGYRFPAVGACDFPFCRALGDSRTYVHSTTRPTPAKWARLAAEGRSFFTTGPMLLLEVDQQPPGSTLGKTGPGPHRVTARVRCRCEVTPVTHLELIVNGATVHKLEVPRAAGLGQWLELEKTLDLTEPSWLAARAYSTGSTAKPDAESHTNPIYITINGRSPYRDEDLDWLLDRIQDQITQASKRQFAERGRVVAFLEQSRAELLGIKAQKGQPVSRSP